MSLEQIEYVDKMLPYYGCSGVTDYDSLFNKHTIPNWDKLKDKITKDLGKIKEIFPIKKLNLNRLSDEITKQQSMALMRGLLKIAKINYVIVRRKESEYVRLDNDKKNLVYYIIHQKMMTTKLMQVPVNQYFDDDSYKMTKRFLIKMHEKKLPEKYKFIMLAGGSEIARTHVMTYDEKLDMWEIIFFSEILVLKEGIPKELMNVIYFNLLRPEYSQFMIYTNMKCDLYIEYYDNTIIPGLESYNDDMKVSKVDVYIKYADKSYDIPSNILTFSCGMCGCKYASKNKYLPRDEKPHDPVDKYYGDIIGKMRKINKNE